MHRKIAERFSSQWIKVKFYEKEPRLKGVSHPKNVRFCEALNLAITQPVLLNKESISCEGAKYAFGWRKRFDNQLLESCQDKRKVNDKVLRALSVSTPCFRTPFSHIGLNTEGKPDLVISCIVPQEMMKIIRAYNDRSGRNMEISLNSMMGLCGNVAVKTYLEQKINISFGCLDSRKFAEIGRERLAIGIPRKLFKLFVG